MKKIISIFIVWALVLSLAACGEVYSPKKDNDAVSAALEYSPDVVESDCVAESYTMELSLDEKENTVSGSQSVELLNKSEKALSEVCFRFFASALAKESEIKKAVNIQTGKKYEVSTNSENNTFISIKLGDDSFKSGEKLSLKLDLVIHIPEISDRFGYTEYENGKKAYNLSFCFPQIAFYDNGEWFDSKYVDAGESSYNEMSDYYITFTAPEEYVVLSSGKSQTANGKTIIEAKNIREMAIAAYNFAEIETKTVNGVTFNLLKPKFDYKDKKLLSASYEMIMETVIESVEIFSEKLGAYIYDELDIIPSQLDLTSGMEMPGLVFLSFPISDDISVVEDFMYSLELSFNAATHEVGHQWFYCSVGNDQFNESWLDESFTSYLEYYYCRSSQKGIKLYKDIAKKYFDTDVSIECNCDSFDQDIYYINFPVDIYKNEDYICVYTLGESFLHELEDAMGQDNFFEMLSDWYNQNQGKIAEGYAFIQHLLEYDSSKEVKEIVNKYISQEQLK